MTKADNSNSVRELKIEELEAAVGGTRMSIKFAPEYTKWVAKAGSSISK
jgi:hypothetical protein